jgi:hypothetical protein
VALNKQARVGHPNQEIDSIPFHAMRKHNHSKYLSALRLKMRKKILGAKIYGIGYPYLPHSSQVGFVNQRNEIGLRNAVLPCQLDHLPSRLPCLLLKGTISPVQICLEVIWFNWPRMGHMILGFKIFLLFL